MSYFVEISGIAANEIEEAAVVEIIREFVTTSLTPPASRVTVNGEFVGQLVLIPVPEP